MHRFLGSIAILAALLGLPRAFAEPVTTKHVTAELMAENAVLEAGAKNLIGIRLEMIPHWHTYWRFPGDSGLPTEVVWELPSGWAADDLLWPMPKRIFVPPLVNYGYEGEALLAAPISVPAAASGDFSILAHVSWLVCKEECVPEKADLTLKVKVGKATPGAHAAAFKKLRTQQPSSFSGNAEIVFKDKLVGLKLNGVAGKVTDFLPLVPMVVKGDAAPSMENGVLWMEKAEPFDAEAKALRGVFTEGKSYFEVSAPLSAKVAAPVEASSPWLLLLFAFLGGLVLNLMPCVFPVLGIKVMSLVRQGGSDRFHARAHGNAYALGVVASFLILAGALLGLRSAGESVGWGFQLQQPMFVVFLILLFSFVAADLAGLIRWSGRWMGAGSSLANRDGMSGSFFTGVLAVVVATPCTAPFMGTAVGAAIAEPAWVVLLVFAMLGLGLAVPFLFLCYQPAFLNVLPKPGVWMERLKELFAFPMVATVCWLLWVLSLQVGADGALKVELGLIVIALSVWLRRRYSSPGGRGLAHLFLFIGILVSALGTQGKPAETSGGAWKPYSEQALEEALNSGKPVFVDFTAAWCLTCQINRKLVLEREGVQNFFKEQGVVLLLADWTNKDPEITRALEKQGRLGVPLYLAFKKGSREPEVLPQVLTEGRIRETYR